MVEQGRVIGLSQTAKERPKEGSPVEVGRPRADRLKQGLNFVIGKVGVERSANGERAGGVFERINDPDPALTGRVAGGVVKFHCDDFARRDDAINH
jgi:hypothetical protein